MEETTQDSPELLQAELESDSKADRLEVEPADLATPAGDSAVPATQADDVAEPTRAQEKDVLDTPAEVEQSDEEDEGWGGLDDDIIAPEDHVLQPEASDNGDSSTVHEPPVGDAAVSEVAQEEEEGWEGLDDSMDHHSIEDTQPQAVEDTQSQADEDTQAITTSQTVENPEAVDESEAHSNRPSLQFQATEPADTEVGM